jgi:nucleoside-diphosphate-sugar epimerase
MKKIIITGANGYLGKIITEHLRENKLNCIELVRNPINVPSYKFELNKPIHNEDIIFKNTDFLIHLAYDFGANISLKKSLQINVEGSRQLFDMVYKYNVRIIYISSITASKDSKSNYGKSKYETEQILNASDCENYILRPGFVYGEKKGGIAATLHNIIKFPVVPLVGGASYCYLTNYKNILQLIESIIDGKQEHYINKPLFAANSKAYTLKEVLKMMGAKILVPFPWQIIWIALKSLEKIGIKVRTGSDNLINLVNQNKKQNFFDVAQGDIFFSDFDKDIMNRWNKE